jgi:hypothetical protein
MRERTKKVDRQEYDVPADQPITDIPRSHEAKKQRLKALVFKLLQKRWEQLPKERATLERIGLRGLIDSL